MTGFKTTRSHGIRQAKQTLTTQAHRRKPGGQFLPGLDNLRFLRTRLSRVGEQPVQQDESPVIGRRCARHQINQVHDWKLGNHVSNWTDWKLGVSLSPTLVPRVSPRGGRETPNTRERPPTAGTVSSTTTASAVVSTTLLLFGAHDVYNNPVSLTGWCTSCAHEMWCSRWSA